MVERFLEFHASFVEIFASEATVGREVAKFCLIICNILI
jgi:hypothetical protein